MKTALNKTALKPIQFVGAGPGDPELITVKGQKALASADLVLYAGSLVPEAVLIWAKPSAERLSSAGMTLEKIVACMIEAHRLGKQVIRLHTGDPSLYGAIYEQMALLAGHDIPYQVIPGVTAAFAAAAALKMEYTLPEISQTLILTRMAGRTPVPELENLTSLASHQASMTIYLSTGLIEKVVDILGKAYGRNAPCIVAYRVSQPDEKIIRTTVDALLETVKASQITRQAVIIIGKVLEASLTQFRHPSKLYDKAFSHGFRP